MTEPKPKLTFDVSAQTRRRAWQRRDLQVGHHLFNTVLPGTLLRGVLRRCDA